MIRPFSRSVCAGAAFTEEKTMSESDQYDDITVPRAVIEALGFELPEEAVRFTLEGTEIVFTLQIVDEVGCDFRIYEKEERFPLDPDKIRQLQQAGYDRPEGVLII